MRPCLPAGRAVERLIGLLVGLLVVVGCCLLPSGSVAAQDLLSLDDGPVATVGSAGDPAGIVIRGTIVVPTEEVRSAIACSVDLLPLRQEGAAMAPWLAGLATKLREGYRRSGFRAASVHAVVEGGHVALDIVEGARTRYAALRIVAPEELKAVITDIITRPATAPAISDSGANQQYQPDIASAAQPDDQAWKPGIGVDDRADIMASYASQLIASLRHRGYGGAEITCAVAEAGPGLADLAITVTHAPVTLRLGAVVVSGIPADQVDALKKWLALPPDARADAELVKGVRTRLRDCGRYLTYQVAWEDEAALPADANGAASGAANGAANGESPDGFVVAAASSATEARVTTSGRSDLLITVKPCPDAPPPWVAARTWDCVIAARAASLARLHAGRSALVFDVTTGSGRDVITWSPQQGFILQVFPVAGGGAVASLVCTAAGFRGDCGGGAWALPGAGVSLRMGLINNVGDDRLTSLSTSFGYSTKGSFAIISTLEPSACCKMALMSSDGKTAEPTWDGAVMELRHASATGSAMVYRADPERGISLNWHNPDGTGGSVGVVDQQWDATLAAASVPVSASAALAAGSASAASTAERPATVGDLLAFSECLGEPPLHQPLHAVLAQVPIGEYLTDMLKTLDSAGESLDIDDAGMGMAVVIAKLALMDDQALSSRMPARAWPRRLLNAIALGGSGDVQAAATSLRPVFDDPDAGPLAFFSCAATARFVGIDPLTVAFADAGMTKCDADGLAADARTFAGFSDPIMTGMGIAADAVAGKEIDTVHAATLRRFARACAQKDRSAARLETLARSAADIGFAEYMKKALTECEDAAASFW